MADSSVDRTLAALAEPTRRAVVHLLRKKPRRAGELAEALSMSAPALSRHLRVLRKTGLIAEDDQEDDARVRVYRLRREPFSELREWLDEVEEFWGTQLQSFKEHAERRADSSRLSEDRSVAIRRPRGRAPS
jgi:DNA-binding transcriptional ArsR family regulator